MKKITINLLLIILLLNSFVKPAYAGWVYEDGKMVLTPDSYTEDGKIKVFCLFERDFPNLRITIELPNIRIPNLEFIGADDLFVNGIITYPNIDEIKPGLFDLEWVFIPNDDKYETIRGYIKYEVYAEDDDISKGKIVSDSDNDDLEYISNPSLTVTKLMLSNKAAYDINLNNKILGSKYKWTSSNSDIAKVNPKNGLVTAVSEGETLITCEILLPDGTTKVLESLVTVGYDENAPKLTDTVLDLEVGDKYDINVENKIKGSSYKWVSSNRDIVKVNSSNGKITAVRAGEAYVTCTIITPEKQVIVLRCDVFITE